MRREPPRASTSGSKAAAQYARLLREEARLAAFSEKIRLVLRVIAVKKLEAESRLEGLRSTTRPCGHHDGGGP